jgi:hypothetical protein
VAPWRGQLVRANTDLLANPPPDGTVVNGRALTFNRADWIVMASIRNTINPADHISPSKTAGTDFDNVEDFVRGLGFTKVEASYHMTTMSKDLDNARQASQLLQRGYRVLLNINAQMLSSDTQDGWGGAFLWGLIPKPNHAVQLVESIDVYPIGMDLDQFPEVNPITAPYRQPGRTPVLGALYAVRFAVYTWAEGHHRVPQDPNKPLKVKDFLWNYYGYLAFKD